MVKRDLLLSLDLGTSGVKAGAFDTRGKLVARASARYDTMMPQPGWVEQNPEAWWAACRQAIREVARLIDPGRFLSMSMAGLSPSLVCVDERGNPVRPAPIWSDRRAVAEVEELTNRLGYDTSFSLLPRLLWLKRNEPSSYARTRAVFQTYEFISFKLTGQAVSIAPLEQFPPWTSEGIQASGLEREKFPPRIGNLGEVLGPLTPAVAAECQLPAGLPVVAGTVDSFAAWIGTATTRKGVVCNTVGTSDGIALVWDQPIRDQRGRVDSMPHVIGRDWIVGGALSSGGITLDWFVRRFCDHLPNAFEIIADEARSVPLGAEGLLALPHLMGERSPINDPHARAVFFGISEKHTRAHFARAVLESVAYAVRDVCEVLVELGGEIEEVRVAGGGAQSDVWSQVKADVLGRPVLVPEIADSGLLGAAIIAGWGVREFGDLSDAATAMVKFRRTLDPRPEHHDLYTRLFGFYQDLYRHLKDDFARMAELNRVIGLELSITEHATW
ncbi:MAG: hypothetical protein HY314_15315 [Acidobacteria bacterium]|nr:hypothetical protein [Acidobacteriota bacterium]